MPRDWQKDLLYILEDYLKTKPGKTEKEKFLNHLKKYIYDSSFQLVGNTARIDRLRKERTGIAEVVFAEGKSYASLEEITFSLIKEQGIKANFLISRLEKTYYYKLENSFFKTFKQKLPLVYNELARIAHTPFKTRTTTQKNQTKKKSTTHLKRSKIPHVAIVTAGTSDQGVAEECAVTLFCWGIMVKKYYDIGVAALDRLLLEIDKINQAEIIVVIAGMEAALASVLGGLVKAPIIAVPTSVGYGSHFRGIASLLGMLNSCAPGIAVVNIDSGFGAASMAYKIIAQK